MRFVFLQNICERAQHACRYSDFRHLPVTGEVSTCATGKIREYTPDRNKEHELRLTLSVRFWANDAQYADAKNRAERELVQLVHGESLALIERIERAVFNGDAKEALGWLGELRDAVEHRAK